MDETELALEGMKTVSLEYFFAMLSSDIVDNQHSIKYTTLMENQDPRMNCGQDVAIFKSTTTPIVQGDKISILRSSLMHQSRFIESNTLEVVMGYKSEFGTPTHLVQVEDKVWMIANPKDFKIVHNTSEGYALLVLAKARTWLYKS